MKKITNSVIASAILATSSIAMAVPGVNSLVVVWFYQMVNL